MFRRELFIAGSRRPLFITAIRLTDRWSCVLDRCPLRAIKSLLNYLPQMNLITEMSMSIKNLRIISISLIMLLSSTAILPPTKAQQESPQRYEPVTVAYAHLEAASDAGNFVIQADLQGAYCRDASQEESQALAARDEFLPLHIITPAKTEEFGPSDAGLKIILRSTQQLETFPPAKNAFLRAAQTWEAVIQTPITVILDVDYGPT